LSHLQALQEKDPSLSMFMVNFGIRTLTIGGTIIAKVHVSIVTIIITTDTCTFTIIVPSIVSVLIPECTINSDKIGSVS
jgi:hypothetical protein